MKLLAIAFLTLSLAANGGTYKVEVTAGPGVDFTSIQAAIDFAQDGDLILVGAGNYPERLVIDGKSLSLIGIGSQDVFGSINFPSISIYFSLPGGSPLVTIRNLSLGQECHFENFDFSFQTQAPSDLIRIENNAGRVWLESFDVTNYGSHAMRVVNSGDVMLRNGQLQSFATYATAALVVEQRSTVSAFGISASGSTPLLCSTVQPSGHGAIVTDSTLRLVDCSLVGGYGCSISSPYPGCYWGAEGGSGLSINSTGLAMPRVELWGGSIKAGAPGAHLEGCGTPPQISPDIDDPLGVLQTISGEVRTFTAPSLPDATGHIPIQVQGVQGDSWFLFVSQETSSALPLAGIQGPLFLDLTSSFQPIHGVVPPSGIHTEDIPVVVPGLRKTFYTQVLFLDLLGNLWASGPNSITLL